MYEYAGRCLQCGQPMYERKSAQTTGKQFAPTCACPERFCVAILNNSAVSSADALTIIWK